LLCGLVYLPDGPFPMIKPNPSRDGDGKPRVSDG
jgi:hypothetical protein